MNNIQTTQFFKLISRFFENRYSEDLEYKIRNWLISPENSQEKQKAMRQQWDSLDNIEDLSSKAELEKIKEKLGFSEKKRVVRLSYYLLRVAAVFLPLIIFIGIYNIAKEKKINKETLTTVITVPYGQHEERKLICGSKVWINSRSEISYNENLNDTARVINLKGEAYLSVMRQNDIPFLVHTKYLDVKVLGTCFNVSAYPDEEFTIVTLDKGSVVIRTIDDRSFMLEPNQQLLFNNKTKEVVIKDIDATIVDWNTGKLVFNNETLRDIVLTLERRFHIEVDVDSKVNMDRRYTVTIDEADNLLEIIEILRCLDQSLSYKINKDMVYIKEQ